MTALLVATAVLLLTSGLVKLRAADRAGLGLPLFALLEILAALALGGASFLSTLTPAVGLSAVVGSVV
ncbi:MAG TPA: hypothetical protein VJ997_00390, partial [Longimicrobiales bacterium]|nr:hypothetical protein [Longimicrobiales bacterium]